MKISKAPLKRMPAVCVVQYTTLTVACTIQHVQYCIGGEESRKNVSMKAATKKPAQNRRHVLRSTQTVMPCSAAELQPRPGQNRLRLNVSGHGIDWARSSLRKDVQGGSQPREGPREGPGSCGRAPGAMKTEIDAISVFMKQ